MTFAQRSEPTRSLGRSGIPVSPIGLGCWAIGGPLWNGNKPEGWGQVDDEESVRGIRRARDLGITLFDTADVYGAGHSETVLGKAIGKRRDDVVIATKFGLTFDESTRQGTGRDTSPEYIRAACDASLRRLGTDRIDLYQFHLADHDPAAAVEVRDTLEELVEAGKIRSYGWSTDDPERLAVFGEGKNCSTMQIAFNVLVRNTEALAYCESASLSALVRSPLSMGLLTGKFTADSKIPSDDVRSGWDLAKGGIADMREKVEKLRGVLGRNDRTLAQGALGWLLARSDVLIPIPGFKSVAQVEDNAGVLRHGALTRDDMEEIESLLGRT